MKQAHGWYLPDHEHHLVEHMAHPKNVREVVDGRVMYQARKQRSAYAHCTQFRTAVDIGGHCGLHSFYLASRFVTVHAFEPVAAHRECFAQNVVAPNVTLHACALGEADGSIAIHTSNGSSGDSWIDGEGDIPLRRLDDFDLQDVDYIKADCEGGELAALRGAEATLKRWHPCVMVEQKPGRAQKFGLKETEAVDYLRSLGAVLRKEISGDFILSWD